MSRTASEPKYTDWMIDSEFSLIRELYTKMKNQGLAPKTIVDYTREPFIFPARS